jgi:hypothetical protein
MKRWSVAFTNEQFHNILLCLFGSEEVPPDLFIVACEKRFNQDAIVFLGTSGVAETGERWDETDLKGSMYEITTRTLNWPEIEKRVGGLIAAKALSRDEVFNEE